VIGADGSPTGNAIVYVEAEGGQTLSAMTKTDGTWRLNLALSRGSDGEVLTYDPAITPVSIFVQAGISGTATAITNTGKTKPVPDIVLGKNQSFVEVVDTTLASTTDTTTNSTGFKNITEEADVALSQEATDSATSMVITYPALNGEMIATSSPEFSGKTAPGTTIRISVHSSLELTQMIKADKDGVWKWTPPQGLEPGVHTVTLEYTDENNVFQRIVRSFTVLAAESVGGLPAFTATPSAIPTLSRTATTSATPSATPSRAASMPSTSSGSLSSTGALGMTILMGALGVILYLFGRVSKKWWRD
jgi:hypothetical protein